MLKRMYLLVKVCLGIVSAQALMLGFFTVRAFMH